MERIMAAPKIDSENAWETWKLKKLWYTILQESLYRLGYLLGYLGRTKKFKSILALTMATHPQYCDFCANFSQHLKVQRSCYV